MNQTEFYKRVSGLLEAKCLQTKRAVVVGLGSGGSRVAAELGRLGVQLLLIERPGELLEEHNIVRHLLGYRSLGKLKLAEMAKLIHNLNPASRMKCCSLDVVEQPERFARELEKWRPDVVAICTDNEASKHAINEVATAQGLPQTGAGVYDGGVGGEVYRVRPGEACYGCIAAALRLRVTASNTQAAPDYGQPAPRDAPAISALSLDIEQIALLQSRLTLELLSPASPGWMGLPPEVNLCVFANRLVPGVFPRPLHAQFFSVAREPGCLYCGQFPGDLDQEANRILADLGTASEPAVVIS